MQVNSIPRILCLTLALLPTLIFAQPMAPHVRKGVPQEVLLQSKSLNCGDIVYSLQVINNGSGCCYRLKADNSNPDNCFVNVALNLDMGAFANFIALPGWQYNTGGPAEYTVRPFMGFIPPGSSSLAEFCIDGTTSATLTLLWEDLCILEGCAATFDVNGCLDPGDASITGVAYLECESLPYSNQVTLPGWTIQLLDTMGNVLTEQVTDVNGAYAFYDLPAGVYVCRQTLLPGWTSSVPATGQYAVTLAPSEPSVRNFGNCRANCLCSSIQTSVIPLSSTPTECCYNLKTQVLGGGDYCFQYLNVQVDAGQFITSWVPQTGWIFTQINPQSIKIAPLSGIIPLGTYVPGSICISGNGTHNILVTAGFEDSAGPHECDASYSFNCPPPQNPCACPSGFPGNNLCINGNFSGLGGFTSNYVLNNVGPLLEGQFWVGANPSLINAGFQACGDHTSGSGNMMVVNGATNASTKIWCETITVSANTNYQFGAWIASLAAASPAQLQLFVNNVSVGGSFQASTQPCDWQQYCQSWFSGTNTTATICLVNLNPSASGNDFALDDLSFRACVSISNCIRGTVYVACDSMPFTNQPTLSGWTISLLNSMGVVLDTMVTDSTGAYAFCDLVPGNYVVKTSKPGWTANVPPTGMYAITLGAGGNLNWDFGVCQDVGCSDISFDFINYEPCKWRLHYNNSSECYPFIRLSLSGGNFQGWLPDTLDGWVGQLISPAEILLTHSSGHAPLGAGAPIDFGIPAGTSPTATVQWESDCSPGASCSDAFLLPGCPANSCQASISVTQGPNCTVQVTAVTAGSQPVSYQWCDGRTDASFTTSQLPCVPTTYCVTATCSDGSTSTALVVFTAQDLTPPIAVCNPGIGGNLGANCVFQLTPALVDGGSSDNCQIQSTSVSTTTFTGCGTFPVTLTVTDYCGNMSTCTTQVQVVDLIPPVIVCPPDLTVNTDPGQCFFTGNLPKPTATDNCNPNPDIYCSIAGAAISPSTQFPKGVHEICCYADDGCVDVSDICNIPCFSGMAKTQKKYPLPPNQRQKNETVVNSAPSSVLSVQSGLSSDYLVRDVLIGGSCFDVSNVTIMGNAKQFGEFSNGSSNVGFSSGVILSTGDITTAIGPNNSDNAGSSISGNTPDAELSTLTSGVIKDRVSLEFDFTPTQTPVTFQYVFASEEYCEKVGSGLSDVLGFFISGPGIVGGQQNIAFIPAGSPVDINSVNHLTNSGLYTNNQPSTSSNLCGQSASTSPAVSELQFDGFTKKFIAVVNVQPCQTYHIKLAIADVGDDLNDSAVFISAGSFDAGGNASVDWVVDGDPVPDLVYEDCAPVALVFDRVGANINLPIVVQFSVSGTATPGIDYVALPTSVIIPAGQAQLVLPVTVLSDAILEGNETIVITLANGCSCSMPQTTLTIRDISILQAKCNYTVTVVDNELPMISCPSAVTVIGIPDANGDCIKTINNLTPAASDNCPMLMVDYTITGSTTGQGQNDASGTTFTDGVSTVSYTATDMNGNTKTCTFNVTVTCASSTCVCGSFTGMYIRTGPGAPSQAVSCGADPITLVCPQAGGSFNLTGFFGSGPTIKTIMVNSCGTEQDNEFMIIHSGANGFNVNDLQVDFDNSSNTGGAQNNDINIGTSSCGWLNGNASMFAGCPNMVVAGPGTFIPADAYVVIQTSSMASSGSLYDFSAFCGVSQPVYVVRNACARSVQAFANTGGPVVHSTSISLNGNCLNTAGVQLNALSNTNGGYFTPPSTYGNVGCTAPPVAQFSSGTSHQINWTLSGPGATQTGNFSNNDSYFGIVLPPTYFTQSGLYTLNLNGELGNEECTCDIQFNVTCTDLCPCDVPPFEKDVDKGFATALWNNSCNACFSPIALNDCDKVEWKVNNTSIGMTNGIQSFCHVFSSPGTYTIDMTVSRFQANGDPCETFTFTKTVQITCVPAPVCDNSVFENPGFEEGAVAGGLNSGGASTGWSAPYGDPNEVINDGKWKIRLTGNLDTADVLSSETAMCLKKIGGMVSLRGTINKSRSNIKNIALFFNTGDNYEFNVFKPASCFRIATLDLSQYDSSWFDLEIPYDLSSWAALDACGDAPHGVLVKPILYVTSFLGNDQGGEETRAEMEIDHLCFNAALVGLDDLPLNKRLRIFPNPNPGTFTVQLPEPASPDLSFRIIGLTGQLLREQHTQTGSTMQTVQAGDLPAGLYFLQMRSEGRVLATVKFVKQ